MASGPWGPSRSSFAAPWSASPVIMAKAPPHPDPITDGAWGASVGHFSSQVLLIGADYTTQGSGSSTPVLAVGRATAGVLRKGGEASLLVFASAAGTDVTAELQRLRKRESIHSVLAFVGAVCFVAGLVLPLFVE